MSEQSGLLQKFKVPESAQRCQSCRGAAAALTPATHQHLTQSYDRELVCQDNPPPYSEINTVHVLSKQQQPLRCQQSAEYGDYPRLSGQFQQQALQQPVDTRLASTGVIRLPADYEIVRVIPHRSPQPQLQQRAPQQPVDTMEYPTVVRVRVPSESKTWSTRCGICCGIIFIIIIIFVFVAIFIKYL